jgi:hypothetical protein
LAEAREIRVAPAAAQEHERERPFAAVGAALGLEADAADPRRADICAMLRGEAVAGPLGSPALGYRLIDAIVSLVARESAEVPMVLAVDDLQWADRSSLAVLQSVLHASMLRVLVVATRRLYPVSAEVESLVATAESCGVVLDLEPLGRDALAGYAQAAIRCSPLNSLMRSSVRAVCNGGAVSSKRLTCRCRRRCAWRSFAACGRSVPTRCMPCGWRPCWVPGFRSPISPSSWIANQRRCFRSFPRPCWPGSSPMSAR